MNRSVGDTGNLQKRKKSTCKEGQINGTGENSVLANGSPKEKILNQNDEDKNLNSKISPSID